MCKIGSRPIGNLNFKTRIIYLMGNTPLRDNYSWFDENKRMAEGKGVVKVEKPRRNDW